MALQNKVNFFSSSLIGIMTFTFNSEHMVLSVPSFRKQIFYNTEISQVFNVFQKFTVGKTN